MHRLLVILGPTASGKTNLAVNMAQHFGGEVISADSRQVYRGMDIGTGKDLASYQNNGKTVPYHLIDILDAGQNYNLSAFQNDFWPVFDHISGKGKLPILCGGTGLYIHSLLQDHQLTQVPINLDLRANLLPLNKEELLEILFSFPAKLYEHADKSSHKRLIRAIEIADYLTSNPAPLANRQLLSPLVIGLNPDLELRRKRILDRLEFRLNNGLIEEVQHLLSNGVNEEMLIFYGLEYKFVVSFLKNELSFEALKEKLGIAICQYAKRQMTFFRKMEKDGITINWLNHSSTADQAKQLVDTYLKE